MQWIQNHTSKRNILFIFIFKTRNVVFIFSDNIYMTKFVPITCNKLNSLLASITVQYVVLIVITSEMKDDVRTGIAK